MNISRVASPSLSFGIVRRDAAKRAIEMTKGDINKLGEIKEVIEEQKDNRLYDIVPVPADSIHCVWNSHFVVLPYGLTYSPESPNFGTFAPRIVSAGHIATIKKNKEIEEYRLKNPEPEEKTPFEIEARKILDMCED